MTDNPLLFALFTYGVTAVVAMLVAGAVFLLHWVIKKGGEKTKEEKA